MGCHPTETLSQYGAVEKGESNSKGRFHVRRCSDAIAGGSSTVH